MGPFGHTKSHDLEDNDPLYVSAPHNPEDVVWAGSDTEQTPQEVQAKRLRYENHAQRYLRGQLPILQSASLRGPLGEGWANPWRYRRQQDLDGWQLGSKDMLFTRANVMKWASNKGLRHLAPTEALSRCKAAAKREVEFRNVNLEDDSRDEDHSDNGLNVGYQSDSSGDPLSQGDDIMHHFLSDPILPPGSCGRSSLAARQHIWDDSERRGNKREANLQWLKGPPISKRPRRDSPTPPSPSPMRNFQGEQARRRGQESTSTRTSSRLQAHNNPESSIALPHGAHEELAGQVIDDQRYFDELGDISEWTTLVSAVDSLRGSEKTQSMLQGSTGDADDDVVRARSPPNERAFATTRHKREAYMDSGMTELVNLPRNPRSSQARDSNTEIIDGDSFITEVAPSSGDVGKFKYRKRRRKGKRSASSISLSEQDAQDHGRTSSKSPARPITLLETKTSNDNDVPPETSPNVEAPQSKDAHQEVYPDSNLQPKEVLPIADLTSIEREASLALSKSDPDWNILDDIELREEPFLIYSEQLLSPLKPDNEKQLSPHIETHHPENGALDEEVQDLLPTSDQEDDRIQSSMSKEMDPHLVKDEAIKRITSSCISKETDPPSDQNEEIERTTSSQSTEEIIQSQIRTEMSILMRNEPPVNGMTEIEEQLRLQSPSRNSKRSQNCDTSDQIRRSASQEVSNENDDADGESDEVKLEALATSKSDGSQKEDSREEGGPQSPWTVDNIQQHRPEVLQGEDEHTSGSSSNRDMQTDQCMVDDNSNRQSPERPKTPDNDGIIPFKEFMTPSPSPSQSRGRPSLGGLPSTQALVEAATRNPWAKNSEPRPKKRVSFGLPEVPELENVTSFEEVPKSPPPPQNGGRLSQDDVCEDGTTTVNTFQKHFAAVEGVGRRLSRKANLPFPIASPAVSAMAEAFIEADRETSVEHRLLASGDESPSRHLQPISQAVTNSSADNDGASPSRSPLRRGAELQMDLDQFLGEADGFLEEWSVETELKKSTEGQSTGGDGDRRIRLFGEMF